MPPQKPFGKPRAFESLASPREKYRKPAIRDLAKLADTAATELLRDDLSTLRRAKAGKQVAKGELTRARERISRMVKGRIPTRIAVAGDDQGPPIPFSYIEVAATASPQELGGSSENSTDTALQSQGRVRRKAKRKPKRRLKSRPDS